MKIAFPYLKSLDHAGGSENGWAINIAKLFLLKGHDVYVGPSFFDECAMADILYMPERVDLREDQTAWNLYKQHTKKILLGVYNPHDTWALQDVPANCLLVTPYRSCGTQCLVLPYAYYAARPEPNFDRKTIGWTMRNPFDAWAGVTRAHHIHLYHLKVCKQFVEEGCKLILFSNNTYPADRSGLPSIINEAHEILDELRGHSRVTVVDHLSYSQYTDLLNQTSVVMSLDGIGSTPEALKLGSIPLCWHSVVNLFDSLPNS